MLSFYNYYFFVVFSYIFIDNCLYFMILYIFIVICNTNNR